MPLKDPLKRKQWQHEHYLKRRKVIQDYKSSMGCADCGYNIHHIALQLDHVPGVEYRHKVLAYVQHLKLPELMDELSKCDVVCANCHAIRTLERGQYHMQPNKL